MTSAQLPTADLETLLPAPLGLRERKKLKTRRAIRAAAFGLFAAQGYEATTVDQIAADADVSPSTFFRYFPTKEDLVVTDDYDPIMEAALRARPAGEPLLDSLRQAIVVPLHSVLEHDLDNMLLRGRLLRDNPAVRARNLADAKRSRDMLLQVFAEREGRPADDFALQVQITAVFAACSLTVEYWAERNGVDNLIDLVEQAFDALASGFTR